MKPNTPGFIGKRLKEARESRELSMQGLADLLGVSRQSISKYESGEQSPRPVVLDEISKILRLPIDFFVNERPHDHLISENPIFYRKLTSATKSIRARAERRYEWLQDISHYLGKFVEFPNVNFPVFDVPSDPNKISDSIIEDLATQTRRFWGLGDGPISNVAWLLENNGVIVGRYSFDTNELDAFSQNLYGKSNENKFRRPHIILGGDKESGARARFTIAHELAHLVLHSEIPKNVFRDSKFHGSIEDQANRFAGAFLFPCKSFMQEVTSVSLDSLRLLKPRWKLSISMLLHRAKDLGLANDEEYRTLRVNLIRRGWRTIEPLDDEIPVEEPKLLRRAMEMIVEQKIQTRDDILNALKIGHRDIEEIIGLPNNYLGEKLASFDTLRVKTERLQDDKTRREDQNSNSDVQGIVLDFASRRRLEN